jgi:hypothetical protein
MRLALINSSKSQAPQNNFSNPTHFSGWLLRPFTQFAAAYSKVLQSSIQTTIREGLHV